MSDWLSGLEALNRRGVPAVLVTVVETRGSTPREAGAKMTVGADTMYDTIGGGQLEHAAIESARCLLLDAGHANSVERHALGPRLGQCCGGVAQLLLERVPGEPQPWLRSVCNARRDRRPLLTATPLGGSARQVIDDDAGPAEQVPRELLDRCRASGRPLFDAGAGWYIDVLAPAAFEVLLFGAGHVGSALAPLLATLPCRLTWVDSRAERFPELPGANLHTEVTREPEALVDAGPAGAFYLVMTHSHPLDLAICERVLARDDFAYCGLIGSASKRRNFEKRLKLKGITQSSLNRLTCPIGVDGISGKRPAEIAIATAAQVLKVRESTAAARKPRASTAG